MTPAVDALTDREKVIQLAEKIMGWKAVEVGTFKLLVRLERQNGFPLEYRTGCKGGSAAMWNPLESIEDAYDLEAALPPDRHHGYLMRLYDSIVGTAPIVGTTKLYWGLVHASARQRCDAMLAWLESR